MLFITINVFSQNYTPSTIDSLLLNGNTDLMRKGKYDEVISWNLKLITISKKQHYKEGEISGLINIGNVLWNVGKFEESIKCLNIAEKELKKNNDAYLFALNYQEYAQAYYAMNLYEMALKYNALASKYNAKALQRGFEIKEEYERKSFLTYLYSCRAEYLKCINLPDSSLIYLHKAIKIKPNSVDLSDIARHHIKYSKKMDSAEFYLKKAKQLIKKIKIAVYQESIVFDAYGDFYFEKKEYGNALIYFEKSLKLAQKIKLSRCVLAEYESIIKTYNVLNNVQKGEEYLKKHNQLQDSLNKVKFKAIDFSVGKMIKEKDDEQTSSKNTLLIYIIVIAFIAFLTLSILLVLNRRKSYLVFEKQEIIIQKEHETRQLERKINVAFDEVILLAKNNDTAFLARFQEVYPEFCQKLNGINPKLNNFELSLCAMIWLNFSSKEIAKYTFIEHRTVQTKKYRLRKKLNISLNTDLYHYLKNLI